VENMNHNTSDMSMKMSGMLETRSMPLKMISRPTEITDMISTIDYLMSRDMLLTSLEQAGVSNWEGWSQAQKMMNNQM
jgi:hypothetical protein